MSRPNQLSPLGLARASDRTASRGSVLVNNPGAIAIVTKRRISAAEIQNSGLRFRSYQASAPRVRTGAPASSGWVPSTWSSAPASSVMGDPRVQHSVEQVDDEVGEQVHEDQRGHRADDGD